MTMSPVSAAVAGALISGVAMYAVGGRAPKVDAFTQPTHVEYVQTVDGRFIPVTPATQPVAPAAGLQPAAAMVPVAAAPLVQPAPVVERVVERPVAQRTAVRSAPAQTRVVERAPTRSWKKTALIIGGSTGAGAGVGGLIGGKKGALIGAAIGGGASSIYEATKR